MRKLVACLILLAILLAAEAAFADPPARGSEEPAGVGATYRVTVTPHWAGTGVAISRDGWVVTTADLIGRCPDAPAPCGIWVEDQAREIWRRAELVASDPGVGIALLRTDGTLPEAATLTSRRVRPGEPVHASGFDGNDRRFLTGSVRGQRLATMFGDPPASGQVVVTTLECPNGSYGTGIFAISDERMIGLLVGTVDASEDADAGRTIAVPSGAVRAFYELNRAAYERRARAARHDR